MYVCIFTSTGDEAVVYKSLPVQEPQYREDFLKCESPFSALTQFPALPAPFPARGKLHADEFLAQTLWFTGKKYISQYSVSPSVDTDRVIMNILY